MVHSFEYNTNSIGNNTKWDINKLVKLKRKSKDIGFFGKKGVGKTTLATLVGFIDFYLFNVDIYSNYHLNFPHFQIRSLKDFDNIKADGRSKLFLGDDFEFWFNSRASKSKVNRDLNEILLNWGKKNCSLVYTSKREMSIDIGLRESTVEFWELSLKQKYYSEDKNLNRIIKNYLNFLYIQVDRFDENLDQLPSFFISNLQLITPFFNTSEEVGSLVSQ